MVSPVVGHIIGIAKCSKLMGAARGGISLKGVNINVPLRRLSMSKSLIAS